jgi:hypothetical protein
MIITIFIAYIIPTFLFVTEYKFNKKYTAHLFTLDFFNIKKLMSHKINQFTKDSIKESILNLYFYLSINNKNITIREKHRHITQDKRFQAFYKLKIKFKKTKTCTFLEAFALWKGFVKAFP